jgi:SNF2 family DNA or RNA helicase
MYSRIDGNVPGPDRQVIIDAFNDERSHYSVCLLTTKACGFGLTLTGADRVIIYDPSWNPGEDRQAVDRAFRIGQTRDVIVYRMIMVSLSIFS